MSGNSGKPDCSVLCACSHVRRLPPEPAVRCCPDGEGPGDHRLGELRVSGQLSAAAAPASLFQTAFGGTSKGSAAASTQPQQRGTCVVMEPIYRLLFTGKRWHLAKENVFSMFHVVVVRMVSVPFTTLELEKASVAGRIKEKTLQKHSNMGNILPVEMNF